MFHFCFRQRRTEGCGCGEGWGDGGKGDTKGNFFPTVIYENVWSNATQPAMWPLT